MEIILEAEAKLPTVKQVESIAEKLTLNFKCEQCDYTNTTEKGLAQHTWMKPRISQVDGNIDSDADDKDLDKAEVSDISHLVFVRNWEKEKYDNVHLLNEVLLEPLAKVFVKWKE